MPDMHRYVAVRALAAIQNLSDQQLQDLSIQCIQATESLAPDLVWLETYFSDTHLFSVYSATSEEVVRRHGELLGHPADNVFRITALVTPALSEIRARREVRA